MMPTRLPNCPTVSSKVVLTTLAALAAMSMAAVMPVAEAHKLTRSAADRYLTRNLNYMKVIIEDPDDPIVPTATTTVIDMAARCGPRQQRRYPHRIACGYFLRVMVHPNPGSTEQHRVLFCGDLKVFVTFRSKRASRLKLVGDRFRCQLVESEGEGPPGAPEGLGGTPPPPPSTSPPPN
jgi:hypothetical protein